MTKTRLGFGIFIAVCFGICMIPSLFMIFYRSDEAIGNETQTTWPALITEEGSFNEHVLDEMGSWFETHYAFRPQLITADARLQVALFQVSNTDPVTVGSDGWLYYTSTLPDYLGEDVLSDRGMWNLAHNVALIENYATAMGAKFLFTVPPNKNTLYPGHMPYYYSQSAGNARNRDHLNEYLHETGVTYLDIFQLIASQEETLYLKEDSHWNNKGAMLVYNAMLNSLEKEHDPYDQAAPAYLPIHEGDLADMIYPADIRPEMDYQYDYETLYQYVPGPASSDPVSVEDYRIETKNTSAADTLLMYRDSFGNTLIPILSNAFASGHYVKATPYPVARDMQQYHPQYVIIELVERNIHNLAKAPAIIPAPKRNIDPALLTALPEVPTEIVQCTSDATYVTFTGEVPQNAVKAHGKIYLAISMPDESTLLYEAFTNSEKDPQTGHYNDYGYTLYLPVGQFGTIETAQQMRVTVYVEK